MKTIELTEAERDAVRQRVAAHRGLFARAAEDRDRSEQDRAVRMAQIAAATERERAAAQAAQAGREAAVTETAVARTVSLAERVAAANERDAGIPFPVKGEVAKLRARAEAQALLAAERAEGVEMPEPITLADLLSADDAEEPSVIAGLLQVGGNVLLAAQRKSGKSTLVHNLLRSLVDGDEFLDYFPTRVRRRVAVLDLELSPSTARSWLAQSGIVHTDAITVVSLRGKVGSLNITDDATRARWARLLRDTGAELLVLDPLRPLMDALSLDENTDGGVITSAFDALKEEAGISEGILVHHAGHGGERARGDSRFQDWADELWTITRENPNDPRSFRFFTAFGRHSDVARGLLSLYDGRRLAFAPETTDSAADRLVEAVVDALRTHGEMTVNDIVALGIRGISKTPAPGILRRAVEAGAVTVRVDGARKIYAAAP